MKKIIFVFLFLILLLPSSSFAMNENTEFSTTKYYKTITYLGNSNLLSLTGNKDNSYTIEITKEEFEDYNPNSLIIPLDVTNGYVETGYKKMTTSIVKNGNNFRYKVVLNWKTMPKTRSFDIIGIGYQSNVKYKQQSINFIQKYCYSSGQCKNDYNYKAYLGKNGVGAKFELPEGTLKTLEQTLYFDIEKTNSSQPLSRQYVYGDYSHATKRISQTDSEKYTVGLNGITLDFSITNYYDAIDSATAIWSGTW